MDVFNVLNAPGEDNAFPAAAPADNVTVIKANDRRYHQDDPVIQIGLGEPTKLFIFTFVNNVYMLILWPGQKV